MDTAVKKPSNANMTAPAIELVPITACANSPTNPRKHFDKDKLAELADSIREHGILQPLLVRPLPDSRAAVGLKYEIVAGERRWRAAKLAGHAHVPVSIRDIPDVQVLELQLTENLQRDDLDPLEEADGYKQLMALKRINADALAELLGKSRSYVYTRTKLNDLCPEARKALVEGKLDASRALLISRIGHHDTQRQCLKDALANRYGGGPMSYRTLHEHIAENYMLRLIDAPFDAKDPELLPKAGPCTTCPKRTGNQPDLFGDVKRADVCTDPKCFDDKRQAHFAGARKDLESQGFKVIAGDAAKKVIPWWDEDNKYRSSRMEGGYVPLDTETYAAGPRKKVKDLLPPDYKPVLIQHPATGAIIKAATQQAVAAAAGKRGKRIAAEGGNYSSLPRPSKPKGPDVDDDLRDRLVKLMHEKAPKSFGRSWLRDLVTEVFESMHVRGDDLASIAKAFGWPKGAFGGGWDKRLPRANVDKLDEHRLVLFMFDLAFLDRGFYGRQRVLRLFGIKESDEREFVLKARKQASAAARAAKKPKASPSKKAAKPAVKGKKK